MATEKQIKANRANARRSTGPKSAEGKAKSAQNAIKHGLLSQSLLVGDESEADFDVLIQGLIDSHQPQDLAEALLVEKMAIALWKMRRLHAVESATIEYRQITSLPPRFLLEEYEEDVQRRILALDYQMHALPLNDDRLVRYQGQLERQFYQALAALRVLQSQRQTDDAIEVSATQS